MNADERRSGLHVAHHERHRFFGFATPISRAGRKTVNEEVPPASGEIRGRDLTHLRLLHV
jgi:hypothetical protein